MRVTPGGHMPDPGQDKSLHQSMEAFTLPFGGDGGIRTPDLYSAIVALSQLSYVPLRRERDYTRWKAQRSMPVVKI